MLVARPKFWDKNIGNGVNSALVANAKNTRPLQKEARFSFVRLSEIGNPSKTFEAIVTPLQVKSMLFSMRTSPRSKISNGSETKNRDKAKAKKFRPLHINNVVVELKPIKETKTPITSPISQPTSVNPS
jgi:hypothetical protein